MNALTLSYRQIAGLFDLLSAGLVVLSPDRQVLHLNRTAEMLTHCSDEEGIGKNCRDVFDDYLCSGDCLFERALRTGVASLSQNLEPSSSDDGQGSLTKIVSPICDTAGEVVACIEIFQDVSAFSELIERLGDESRKLRAILDLLDIGVFTCDRGGHITFFNAMAENITGFPRRNLLGKTCGSVFNRDFCTPLSQARAEDNTSKAKEVRLKTREGREIPVRAKYLPLLGNTGEPAGMLTTFTDLSLVYQYRNVLKDRSTFYDMISAAPKMQRIVEILPAIAESDATVLIAGPTGTGKDLLAKVIHTASQRAEKSLVKVNCAALPDNLLESEMFGYVKGAFTGADRDKPGRFQEADGGTIFLDEIGDMPLALQAKLLRVLEDREFYPLGSRRPSRVNVRILSATNHDLKTMVAEKKFREDLYYRLNVMCVELPPLRERRTDIPLLIEHILKKLSLVNSTQIDTLTESAMEILLNYDYPGNVRELENILEHALIVSRGSNIDRCHLPISLQQNPAAPETISSSPMGRFEKERQCILATLEAQNWNKGNTARSLHMDRSTLWRKMKKYGIQG